MAEREGYGRRDGPLFELLGLIERSSISRDRPPSAGVNSGSRSQSPPDSSQSNVRHYHFPGGSMTIASSSMTFGGESGSGGPGASGDFAGRRNTYGPQPLNRPPEIIDQMVAQMFANIGVFPRASAGGGDQSGQEAGMPGTGSRGLFILAGRLMPFNFETRIGGPGMNGRVGDAIFSQETLDRVITQFMEHQSGLGCGD